MTVSHIVDEDSTKFNLVDTLKYLFMVSDTSFVVVNNEFGIPDGEVGILDFNGFSWWHLMKVAGNLTVLRAFLRYVQVSD